MDQWAGPAARLYAQREKRFNDVVALRKPDRVPLVPLVLHYFPTRIRGTSNRDAGYDHTLRMNALRDATLEFGWDFAPPSGTFGHDGYEALATKQFRWPGGDLPDNDPFQFVENEYLRADEVDAFLADPNGFTLRTILPRISGGLEGLGQVPVPPLYWFSNMYNLQTVGGPLFASPSLRKALQTMLDLADAADSANAALGAYVGQMTGMGYSVTWAIATIPAFDLVSDTLRSLHGSTLDMFRQPEKLLATIDLMQVPTVALAVQGAKMLGNPRVFIPMHRGAGGFMSDEQFERFYWPTFVALIDALLAEGLVPMPLFEGDYTPRLEYLAQLPPGKVAAHFDRIDRKKFKEVCGQTLCFWGPGARGSKRRASRPSSSTPFTASPTRSSRRARGSRPTRARRGRRTPSGRSSSTGWPRRAAYRVSVEHSRYVSQALDVRTDTDVTSVSSA